MTLGMLNESQAGRLKDAGLDYYNHNLNTSREYYSHIISTRTFDDRLNTLEYVRQAGMKVCSGGIVGLGEKKEDRIGLLQELATMPIHQNLCQSTCWFQLKARHWQMLKKLDVNGMDSYPYPQLRALSCRTAISAYLQVVKHFLTQTKHLHLWRVQTRCSRVRNY